MPGSGVTEAEQLVAACLSAAQDADLIHNEYVTYGYFAAALIATERLELDIAQRCLKESAQRNLLRRDTSFFDFQRHLEARAAVAAGRDAEARSVLSRPVRSAVEPPVLAYANQALLVRVHLRSGDLLRARALASRDSSAMDEAVRVDVALASGEVDEAQHRIDRWQPADGDVTARVQRLLRGAAIARLAGDDGAAREVTIAALGLAEGEGLRRPFRDVPEVRPIVARLAQRGGEDFARSVVTAGDRLTSDRSGGGLVEPLTDREMVLLRYLPSRLTNADIAEELYVSVNTVKTHLRHIYWKLDVVDRNAAVERAEALDLL